MTCSPTLTINASGDWAATTVATDENGAALGLTGPASGAAPRDGAGVNTAHGGDGARGEVRIWIG